MEKTADSQGVAGGYRFKIGESEAVEETFSLIDPVPTGRQILQKSGRRPEQDFQLLLMTTKGDLEEIGLDETVDLRTRGVERFFAFKAERLFFFVIDERRFPWGAPTILESTLKFLAQVGADYTVWLERQGAQEDLRIAPGSSVPLGGAGVEVFFTGKDETNAGDGLDDLPEADRRYLIDKDFKVEIVTEKKQTALVLREVQLPQNRFQADKCDLLVMLPSGYPDAAPDMFYADPWLKIKGSDSFPYKADKAHQFAGRSWQRWSRHNSEWRAGVDGLRTFLQRVFTALESAQ